MAERKKPGFNIPLNFYDGPEVDSIPRRIRAAAVGVWALAGNYAATQLSDGYVPAGILKSFGCTDAIRAALKVTINKKGELSPLWIDAINGGVQLTNWPKHQRTNDEVTNYRESEAERKRVEREAKRNGASSGNGRLSGRTFEGRATAVRPDTGTPKTETETETKTESVPSVTKDVCAQPVAASGTHTTRPSEFCSKHPAGTADRCGDCANARRAANAWDTAEADRLGVAANARSVAAAARIAAIDECPICDPNGLRYSDPDDYSSPLVRCAHTEEHANA